MDLTQVYFLHEIGEKSNQEDYIWPDGRSASINDKIFIVCDGVGGSENGEVASRVIADFVGNAIQKIDKEQLSGIIINDILLDARLALIQYARDSGLHTDMGTTFSLLVLLSGKIFVAWCGDSRIYHIRRGDILYQTSDHSLVNSLVKSGEITEEEALKHPRRNIILRAIKADESNTEADHHFIEDIQDGDYFMLCSDGLLENINAKNLRFLLTENDKGNIDLVKAFQQFCFGKTRDNYSMYLLHVQVSSSSLGYKGKITALVLFLIVLVAASGAILGNYFSKKHDSPAPAFVQPIDSSSRQGHDTLVVRVDTNRSSDVVISEMPILPAVTNKKTDSILSSKHSTSQTSDEERVNKSDSTKMKLPAEKAKSDSLVDNQPDSITKPKAVMPGRQDSTQNQ